MKTNSARILCSLSLVATSLFGDQKQTLEQTIQPVLNKYCLNCHSTEKQKGDLDLEGSDIQKEPHIWENVLEQIEMGEMPPKKEKQLSASEKTQLTDWVRGTLDQIALANAGDPGPVVLRRLSNMEYTYTLRDLTGIESLDPAKEFPVDGAAGEGFTNAGAALVMSPALLTKYLDAAKAIASHAVFTPHGMRWSASTSAQDWTDEALASIRAIYARHTATAEATQTEAQGIKLDTGTGGGRLPLARYLDALQGRSSAEGLSPKYLQILRESLTSTKPSVLLDPLRAKFRQKKLTTADIEPFDGHVTLYMADRYHDDAIMFEPRYGIRQPDGGWGQFASDLEVVPIGGEHIQAIDEPYIAKVGAHLSEAISRIQSEATDVQEKQPK